jgi:NAD(P)-dependent dehydrogenase (short-subunit alcohol dehydrogenase family)
MNAGDEFCLDGSDFFGAGPGHAMIIIISDSSASDLFIDGTPALCQNFFMPDHSTALAGKTLVVVGGTTGLGLSAAQAFLAAGARGVVVTGRNPASADAALGALGTAARAVSGDACSPEHADEAIRMAIQTFGAFDGLYHVAGGSGRKQGDGPLHEISDAGWQATLHLNLTSLFNSNRAAVRAFIERKTAGSILNMGSVLGVSPSPQFFVTHAYAAAKSAVVGFTQSCAAYYAPHNIRFNVLAPALVETPMAQRAAQDATILKFIKTKQPLDSGRIGQPSDLDAAAVYFLSDGSRFTTGQMLAVDGGWSVSEGQIPD